MNRPRFWISSILSALVFAGAAAWLFPYSLLRLETDVERHRAWLLTLWTTGVMAICFGAAGLLTSVLPLGFRDVAEAGSVSAAREARRLDTAAESPFYNFAGWVVTTGAFLLIIYFVLWLGGR